MEPNMSMYNCKVHDILSPSGGACRLEVHAIIITIMAIIIN